MTPAIRLHRVAIVSLAALLVVAPLSSGRAEATYFGLTLPDKVAGATRGPTTDFEKSFPGASYGTLYYQRDLQIDVNIYDNGEPPIPDDEVKGTALKRRVGGVKVEFVRERVVADRDGRARLLCADFVYTYSNAGSNAGKHDNVVCFAGWRGKFVEFELYVEPHPAANAEAKRFIETWLPILWP